MSHGTAMLVHSFTMKIRKKIGSIHLQYFAPHAGLVYDVTDMTVYDVTDMTVYDVTDTIVCDVTHETVYDVTGTTDYDVTDIFFMM